MHTVFIKKENGKYIMYNLKSEYKTAKDFNTLQELFYSLYLNEKGSFVYGYSFKK
ncbi:hypothetical protein FACS1894132_12570 [Clostridia bacterium]|nr:hypothetical protein FACS1894132_12570 [Clostridia bacterium]